MFKRLPFHPAIIASGLVSLATAYSGHAEERELETIVVTARKVEENVQTVPIAIRAITGNELQKASVKDSQDLKFLVPGFQINYTPSLPTAAAITIRGQRNFSDTVGTIDTSTAVYVDGVYGARSSAAIANLFDTERIEVLKGPQGTLFGRNATGGALNVTTVAPKSEFGGYVRATAGNLNLYGGEGALNVPFGETLALRIAGSGEKRDGYVHNLYPGQGDMGSNNESNYRVALKWSPDDSLSIVARGSWRSVRTTASPYHFFARSPSACNPPATATQGYNTECRPYTQVNGVTLPAGFATPYLQAEIASDDIWSTYSALSGYTRFDTETFSATLDKQFESFHVKLLGAYSDSSQLSIGYGGPSPGPVLGSVTYFPQTTHSYQGELTFSGDKLLDGKLKWASGVFYFKEGSPVDGTVSFQTFTPPANPARNLGGWGNESYAVYAQGTYSIVPRLRFTAGVRETWDNREVDKRNSTGNYDYGASASDIIAAQGAACTIRNPNNPSVVLPIDQCNVHQDVKFNALTYTLALDYDISDRVLAYVTNRRGYRSGGLNLRSVDPRLSSFKPEFVTDYEAGLKADWRVGSMPMRSNLAAYFSNYEDVQRQVILSVLDSVPNCVPGGLPACVNNVVAENAKKAQVYGAELDINALPLDDLQVTLGGSYTHAIFTDYNLVVPPGYALTPGINGNLTNRPFGIPRIGASSAINYTLPFRSLFGLPTEEMSIRLDYYWQSRNLTETPEAQLDARRINGSYGLFNARLNFDGVGLPGLDVDFWVKNLTNKDYYILGSESGLGGVLGGPALGAPGAFSGTPGLPRTFGVQLGYKFGKN